MSEPQAWFCPSCQKHHAPHVGTCPGNGIPNASGIPYVVAPFNQPFRQPCVGACGCGPDCPNRRFGSMYQGAH